MQSKEEAVHSHSQAKNYPMIQTQFPSTTVCVLSQWASGCI